MSLRSKIFAYSTVLVMGMVGLVLLFSYLRASHLAEESLEQALATSRSLYRNFETERLQKLELVNSVVAESPIFKALIAERADAATWLDSAQAMVQQVGSDFMIVTDDEGVLLARTDVAGRAGQSLVDHPLVRRALEGENAGGIWQEGEKLYHAVAVPLVFGPTIVGSVTSGYAIGDRLAQEIKRFASCEVVFLAGESADLRVTASTLAETTRYLRDWLATEGVRGSVSDARLMLADESFHAAIEPLVTVGGDTVGFFAALRSRDRELAGFRAFQRSVLAVGGVALVVAVLAGLFVSRGITRPIQRLVHLTDRIREGDYESQVEVDSQDEIGVLAGSFQALLGELREKALMEKYISKSAAEMIQKTQAVRVQEGERLPVTVLFSDLRASTSLSGETKPQELLARINRALGKQAELVERYYGHVDKFIGDRMMAFFRGSDAVWQAVRCAKAIHEFLESEQTSGASLLRPSIGISSGEAIFGNVGSADRLDYTLLGTAVREAARLCDEASSGEVLMTDEAYRAVRDRLPAETHPPINMAGRDTGVAAYRVSRGAGWRPESPTGATDTRTLQVETGPGAPRPPSPSASGIRPGMVLGGRYEMRSVVGRGGMGMVFLAHDLELDEPVAIKVLRPEIVSMDPTILERFKQEIRVARRITHRNVVRTYDFQDMDGVKFITMEYVEGMTLKQLIQSKGALPLAVGLQVAKQTCAGLTVAHEQGVVHRDVKPQNIKLTPASEVKIMDFGIARPVEMRGITVTGLVVGTPNYMSPEQAQGKQDLDTRSDIYSTGVVLFEMFTGELPFEGDSALGIAMKHVQEAPPPPRVVKPDLPSALEAVILHCLEKDPARRYPNMAALHRDLQRVSKTLS